ncbi:MAG: hypothetical protein JRJ11_17810 [Deltaproteobacteria bacterium]|nr:hypothetical protein [Deltaproteobacteria bacterium]MBW2358768.1 hypothetical protein [Deltaproteobacteria bacterium]
MKRAMRTMLCIFVLVTITGCYSPVVFSARTYDGKIVDADTGEPIEGVVALCIWKKESVLWPTDTVDKFCDARENVTNKDGDFVIEGTNIIIFKAGYEYLATSYEGLKEDIGLRDRIKWKGSKAIIPLKKLTMEERKKQGTPYGPPSEAPFNKVKLFLKEINKDRKARGLKPLTLWGGVRYE